MDPQSDMVEKWNEDLQDLLDWMIYLNDSEPQDLDERMKRADDIVSNRENYRSLFGDMTVDLSPYGQTMDYPEPEDRAFVAVNRSIPTIQVFGFPFCLEYLEYFGPEIRNLIVRFKDSSDRSSVPDNQRIIHHAFAYCSDLISIKFPSMTDQLTQAFDLFDGVPIAPNESVTELTFDVIRIGGQLTWFSRYYAKVTKLVLYNASFDNNFTLATFQNLEELHLKLRLRSGQNKDFQLQSISRFLRANAHKLEKINIVSGERGSMQKKSTDSRAVEKYINNQGFINTFPDLRNLTQLNLKHYVLRFEDALGLFEACVKLNQFWFSMSKKDQEKEQSLHAHLDDETTLARAGHHNEDRYVYTLNRSTADDMNAAFFGG